MARFLLLSLIPQRVFWSLPPLWFSSFAYWILSRSSSCTSTTVKNTRQQAGGVELSERVTGRGFLHSHFKKLRKEGSSRRMVKGWRGGVDKRIRSGERKPGNKVQKGREKESC